MILEHAILPVYPGGEEAEFEWALEQDCSLISCQPGPMLFPICVTPPQAGPPGTGLVASWNIAATTTSVSLVGAALVRPDRIAMDAGQPDLRGGPAQ